jgi:hypothetical protein
MCFSATGSFAVSGVLTGLGAASILRNPSKPNRMFAAIPLIFAAQQASEGVVWLTIHGEAHARLHQVAVIVYLACALVIWPTWLPWSLLWVEKQPSRHRVLAAILGVGALFSACALFVLLRARPIARIVGHSLEYEYAHSGKFPLPLIYLVAYLVPTVAPLFVSTANLARVIGTMLVLSLGATVLIQRNALTSVWCFFAAILSSLIILSVERLRHTATTAPRPPGPRPHHPDRLPLGVP